MAFNPNEVGEQLPPKMETQESAENREASFGAPEAMPQPQAQYVPEANRSTEHIVVPHQEAPQVRVEQDPVLARVEEILGNDHLRKIYDRIPEGKKLPFKEVGEKLARDIRDGIQRHKLNEYKVLMGIRKWLMMIPDVEKYYLLQEAKIDLDQVLALSEEVAQGSQNVM